MGSIRIPAAYCGVYGFKPAQAHVSQQGLELAERDFDAIGPLARSLDMLERVARAMSDFGDETGASGWTALTDLGGVECQPAVLDGFAKARAACGTVAEIALPHPLSRVRFAGFIKTVRFMATHFAEADPSLLSDHLRRLIAYGPRRSEADWAEDQRILAETADALRDAIARHGALLLPTAPQ
ncbi:amidase family protein, partial [Blastomonas sp. UPD001]|uniref:amidase family protein n=1 Tax=Blastomonas sp. UPD001 TaxID=2217673 RepID=UPI0018E534BE